jgi:hypothetical protein
MRDSKLRINWETPYAGRHGIDPMSLRAENVTHEEYLKMVLEYYDDPTHVVLAPTRTQILEHGSKLISYLQPILGTAEWCLIVHVHRNKEFCDTLRMIQRGITLRIDHPDQW